MTKDRLERFEAKFVPDPNSGCWLWTASVTHGYGRFAGGPGAGSVAVQAHRQAYRHYIGPIPKDMDLDHLCRVRCCVNPKHLEPVTCQENILRGDAPKIAGKYQLVKTHCPNGHPYNGDNLYVNPQGSRKCRTCVNAAAQKWFRKQRKGILSEETLDKLSVKVNAQWQRVKDLGLKNCKELADYEKKHRLPCLAGHPYTDEGTSYYRGIRACKECNRIKSHNYYQTVGKYKRLQK